MGFWRNKTFTLSDIQGKVKINGFDLNDLILCTEYISSLSYDGEKFYANNHDITHYLKKLNDYNVTIEQDETASKKKEKEDNLPTKPQPIVLEKDNKKDEAEDKTLVFSELSIQIDGSVGEVSCEESFTLKSNDIKGNIHSDGNIDITANDISSNITADGQVVINGNVNGDVNAEGDLDITGNATSDDISGSDITIKGQLTTRNFSAEGNVSAGGDISGEDFSIGGDIIAKGSIKANEINADNDVKASGTITANEINASGSVYMNAGKSI
jgi:cytoskeletal protein CcmA (bactofilin family)